MQIEEPTMPLGDFMKAQKIPRTRVAKALGVSVQTVKTWVDLNAIPPKHVAKLAVLYQLAPWDIFPYTKTTYKPVEAAPKTIRDLHALNNAYYGRDYETSLSSHAVRKALETWGDRFPLMYETLCLLYEKKIGPTEAAQRMSCSVSTINGLRKRYGIAPGKQKPSKKPLKKKDKTAKEVEKWSHEVISGRKSVATASKEVSISLRTLHRHIASMLRPLTLNEISHWSLNFRTALSQDLARGAGFRVARWREWVDARGYALKKAPKWPKLPLDREAWRKLGARQIAVQVLSGQASLEEAASSRGGSQVVLEDMIRTQTGPIGVASPLSLSVAHQAALAEILLALEGARRPEMYSLAKPITPEELSHDQQGEAKPD